MRSLIFCCILIIITSSCKLLSPTVMFETEPDFQYKEFDNTQKTTIIQPYDQLQILMYTNNGSRLLESNQIGTTQSSNSSRSSQSLTYMVRTDSTVKLPTLDLVKLGGMPKDSAEVFLEQELGKYYQNPFIKLYITNRNIIMFFNEGTDGLSINIPEEGITLLDAIAEAGGLTENSKAYKIKLIRGDNQNPKIFNFNIRSVDEFKKANFVLEANDIIYVDSRPQYINKVLREIQPYLVLASTSVLIFSIFN
ncbi:MAG: polysaccharide biosynthesis/export family protein [Bacteroidales bacterium]|nr:polysaccharide biosynthesis/export family protein [Bacteroidales bacterium]